MSARDTPERLDTEQFTADPHALFARLRETAPAVPVVISGGINAWLITRYEPARAALTNVDMAKEVRHWRAFNAGEVPFTGDVAVAARRNILSSDPPDHTRLRRVLASAFTPRRIEALRPWVKAITTELLDAIAPKGEADLVAEFALPIPMTVICELFGVPEQSRAEIRSWTETLFHSGSPDRMREASQEIDALLGGFLAGHSPDAPDFTAALVRAQRAGELSDEELLALLRAMLAGGNETTVNLIGNAIAALLRHPDQLRLVQEKPELWPAVVDEVLRWDGPIQNAIWRFAVRDIKIGEVTIPQGDAIIIGLAAANRDEDAFAEPGRFDIGRIGQAHLAFGRGVHHCIGAPLAKLQASVALPAVFARLPELRCAVGWEELAYRRSTMSRGLVRLPVAFSSVRSN